MNIILIHKTNYFKYQNDILRTNIKDFEKFFKEMKKDFSYDDILVDKLTYYYNKLKKLEVLN